MDFPLRDQTRMSINEPGRGIFAGDSAAAVMPVVVAVTGAVAAWPAEAVFET